MCLELSYFPLEGPRFPGCTHRCLCYLLAPQGPGSHCHRPPQPALSTLPGKSRRGGVGGVAAAPGTGGGSLLTPHRALRWLGPEEHFHRQHYIRGSRGDGGNDSMVAAGATGRGEGGSLPAGCGSGAVGTKAKPAASRTLLRSARSPEVVYSEKGRAGRGPARWGSRSRCNEERGAPSGAGGETALQPYVVGSLGPARHLVPGEEGWPSRRTVRKLAPRSNR